MDDRNIDLMAALEKSLREARLGVGRRDETGRRLTSRSKPDISGPLLDAGPRAATVALQLYGQSKSNETEIGLRAGMAVEYMAKWFLSSIDPVLIADLRDFPTLVILTGNADLLKTTNGTPPAVRTVTAREACQRIALLFGREWKFFPREDFHVLDGRNEVVHLGTFGAEIRPTLRTMVRLVEGLRQLGRVEPVSVSEFWGETADLLRMLLDENAVEIEELIEAKLAAARSTLDQRMAGLSPTDRAIVLGTLAEVQPNMYEYYERRECPVCSQEGWLFSELEKGDQIAAYPSWFRCQACGLALEDQELQIIENTEPFELDADFMRRDNAPRQ
jgi:hypothetical protein